MPDSMTTVTILLTAPLTPHDYPEDIESAFTSLNCALARRGLEFAFRRVANVTDLSDAAKDDYSIPLALIDPSDAAGAREAAEILSRFRSATTFAHQRPSYIVIPMLGDTALDTAPAFKAAIDGGSPVLPFFHANDVANTILHELEAKIGRYAPSDIIHPLAEYENGGLLVENHEAFALDSLALYHGKGLETQARFTARAIVAVNGDSNASPRGRHAAALAIAGRYNDALAALNGLDDTDSSGQRLLTALLLTCSDSETLPAAADDAFLKALEANPESANLRIEHILYLEHTGRTDDAIKQADQLHQENPQNLRLAKTLFDLLAKHARIPASRVVDQQDIRTNGRLGASGRARHALEAAMLFEAAGANQDARDQYKTAERDLKDSGESWLPEYALALSGHARMLANLRKTSEALKGAQTAAPIWRRLNKEFNERWTSEEANNLAFILDNGIAAIEAEERETFLEHAVSVLAKAGDTAPNSFLPALARARNYHANVQCGKGRFDAARKELAKARKLYEELSEGLDTRQAREQASRGFWLCVCDQALVDYMEFLSTRKEELLKAAHKHLSEAQAKWSDVADEDLHSAYSSHCDLQGQTDFQEEEFWENVSNPKTPAAAPRTPPPVPATPPPVPSAPRAGRAARTFLPPTPPPVPTTPPRTNGQARRSLSMAEAKELFEILASSDLTESKAGALVEQLSPLDRSPTVTILLAKAEAKYAELLSESRKPNAAAEHAQKAAHHYRSLTGHHFDSHRHELANVLYLAAFASAIDGQKDKARDTWFAAEQVYSGVDQVYRASIERMRREAQRLTQTGNPQPRSQTAPEPAAQAPSSAPASPQPARATSLEDGLRDFFGANTFKFIGNRQAAVAELRSLAARKNATSQFLLGRCLEEAWGCKRNPAEALRWYTVAGKQGNLDAIYHTGRCHEQAIGTVKNLPLAAQQYLTAAARGHAEAAYRLGCCHRDGNGIDQDYAHAVRWFRKAAEQGHAEAQYNLGVNYRDGNGVEQDYQQAAAWFRRAAELGHERAEEALEVLDKPPLQGHTSHAAAQLLALSDAIGAPTRSEAPNRAEADLKAPLERSAAQLTILKELAASAEAVRKEAEELAASTEDKALRKEAEERVARAEANRKEAEELAASTEKKLEKLAAQQADFEELAASAEAYRKEAEELAASTEDKALRKKAEELAASAEASLKRAKETAARIEAERKAAEQGLQQAVEVLAELEPKPDGNQDGSAPAPDSDVEPQIHGTLASMPASVATGSAYRVWSALQQVCARGEQKGVKTVSELSATHKAGEPEIRTDDSRTSESSAPARSGTQPERTTDMTMNESDASRPADSAAAQKLYDEAMKVSLTKSMAEGVALFRQAAELGHADAMYRLGDAYAKGRGVDPDANEARRWFERAAQAGHEEAAKALADLPELNGNAITDDAIEAAFRFPAVFDVERTRNDGTPAAPEAPSAQDSTTSTEDTPRPSQWACRRESWTDTGASASGGDDTEALYERGRALLFGEGIREDQAQAVRFLRRAGEQNHPGAHNLLGRAYMEGWGVSPDPAKVVEHFRAAAGYGHPSGMLNYGILLANGAGVEQDLEAAAEFYERAAELGNPQAQDRLGDCYRGAQGKPKDPEKAAYWYRKAAEAGNAYAQDSLSWCYWTGFGVPQDDRAAFEWRLKAAEAGNASAQYSLGDYYRHGVGTSKDDSKAFHWWKNAAEQGYTSAFNSLGRAYDEGWGTPVDKSKAVEWYRKAAERGHDAAQNNLGFCYLNGEGTARDPEAAVLWFRKAAEQGNKYSQEMLGFCYRDGLGVAADANEAIRWFEKAAAQGDKDSIKALEELRTTALPKPSADAVATPDAPNSAQPEPSNATPPAPPIAKRARGFLRRLGFGATGVVLLAAVAGGAILWGSTSASSGESSLSAEELYQMAEDYAYGANGETSDPVEAARLYRLAADQGEADAQYKLAYCYANGRGVPRDAAQAEQWYAKAVESYRQSATQGDTDAQHQLGYCYFRGRGVPQDDGEAVHWFSEAANNGHIDAQYKLAYCYEHGRGLTKDEAQAAKWYGKAIDSYRKDADQGNPDAQYKLAETYRHGRGESQDDAQAANWYAKAAEGGNVGAQYELGQCYEHGRGMPQDNAKAAHWYEEAAKHGHVQAQEKISNCYRYGVGVPRNTTKADQWQSKANA